MNSRELDGLFYIAAAVSLSLLAHVLAQRGGARLGMSRQASGLITGAIAYVGAQAMGGQFD